MEQKVVFVTGGSSGIGLSVCKALHARGCRVYEISRREVQHTDIIHIGADVANEESVRAAASYVTEKEGKIDILINNAGYGISGAVEFTDGKDAKRLFDVDFFGMDSVTRAVLPVMRQNGGGRIVNISSVAAALPIPFQTYYSAVKAAVSAYSLALADEVRPFGIEVLSIMPGIFGPVLQRQELNLIRATISMAGVWNDPFPKWSVTKSGVCPVMLPERG